MKNKAVNIVFYLCIFIGLFSFFYIAHPMILFDADDWTNASYWRRPLPIPGGFNGIKVFPETFQPLVSEIGAFAVYPFLKDYLKSIAFVYALALAGAILIYVMLLEKVIGRITKESWINKAVSLSFLFLHFLIFKNDWAGNEHLFYAQDPTCVFNYILPMLLNASLVLWLLDREWDGVSVSSDILNKRVTGFGAAALLLAVYLAVFSSMFHNAIFATFCGAKLLTFIPKKLNNTELKKFVTNAWFYITGLCFWLIALIIQAMDIRNSVVKEQESVSGLSEAVSGFTAKMGSVNKLAVLIIAVIIIAAAVKAFREKLKMKAVPVLVLSGVLTTVYLILMAAVAGNGYIKRSDVLVAVFFWAFTAVALMLAYIVKESRTSIILLILVFILGSQTLNYCKSYADYNVFGLSWEQTYMAGQDILTQFEEAEAAGLTGMELHVTDNRSWNNTWPYPEYAGDAISDTLFRHGIIRNQIKCTVVYDEKKNAELGINY